MAQIRTIDGERHNVEETREEIYNIINSQECLAVGVVPLNMRCSISGWENGEETQKWVYEPVSFLKCNIIMYY